MPLFPDLMTLAQAAESLGVTPDTLRQQAQAGNFSASKIGNIWVTTPAAVERYRRERLGQVGPKAGKRSARKAKG